MDDGFIGVKRMGELDITAFSTACKRDHSLLGPDVWQDYLSDPSWHPFKAIEDKFGNRKVYIPNKQIQQLVARIPLLMTFFFS